MTPFKTVSKGAQTISKICSPESHFGPSELSLKLEDVKPNESVERTSQ